MLLQSNEAFLSNAYTVYLSFTECLAIYRLHTQPVMMSDFFFFNDSALFLGQKMFYKVKELQAKIIFCSLHCKLQAFFRQAFAFEVGGGEGKPQSFAHIFLTAYASLF